MPGIYGIVNSKNIKNNLECMAKEMHLYDHFIQDEIFYDEKIGASRAHTGQVGEASSPVKQDNYAVWVEGEAYNISEVAAELTLDADNETVTIKTAINNAIGVTAEALMIDIFKVAPKDGDDLTAAHKKSLDKLLSAQEAPEGQAHIIIAEYSIALFMLDHAWAEQHLIPRFDWGNKDVAIFWQGFSLAPTTQWAFLEAIKNHL